MEDRMSIEILHTSGFSNAFIGAFLDKNRSNIKREIDTSFLDVYRVESSKCLVG